MKDSISYRCPLDEVSDEEKRDGILIQMIEKINISNNH